jgi:hypothetical protein
VCNSAVGYVTKRVESQPGDVLGLATRGVPPFRLAKEKTTLNDLRTRIMQAGAR